ncbi:translation initiation factor IF-2-like [Zalophus californianus]|uniref:Translation initiation factor IF-2-like n=1 Tax=Zalophus californianus TaxID=9704 RepID=A0A6J2BLF3_ZALCA|nr:translation initiation factor IF-2-like [Zalophus californianus]
MAREGLRQTAPPPSTGPAPPHPAFLRSWPSVIGQRRVTRGRSRSPLVRRARRGRGRGVQRGGRGVHRGCCGPGLEWAGGGGGRPAGSRAGGPGGPGHCSAPQEGSGTRRSFLLGQILPHRLTHFRTTESNPKRRDFQTDDFLPRLTDGCHLCLTTFSLVRHIGPRAEWKVERESERASKPVGPWMRKKPAKKFREIRAFRK